MLAPVAGLAQAVPGPMQVLTQATPCSARGAVALASGAPGLAAAVRVGLV